MSSHFPLVPFSTCVATFRSTEALRPQSMYSNRLPCIITAAAQHCKRKRSDSLCLLFCMLIMSTAGLSRNIATVCTFLAKVAGVANLTRSQMKRWDFGRISACTWRAIFRDGHRNTYWAQLASAEAAQMRDLPDPTSTTALHHAPFSHAGLSHLKDRLESRPAPKQVLIVKDTAIAMKDMNTMIAAGSRTNSYKNWNVAV
jgi:hypothetical protein